MKAQSLTAVRENINKSENH